MPKLKKPVYLDYHATTPCMMDESMTVYFRKRFGNVSSANAHGRMLREPLECAMDWMSARIHALGGITLTSGATEANNIAICGLSPQGKRNEILISALEHESVTKSALHMATRGFTIRVIPATKDGFIEPAALEKMVGDKTLLVSVIAASNEIGTIQPIKQLAEIAHRAGALFHSDATQALNTLDINVDRDGIDLLSFSSHKIYGPPGIGALYVQQRPPIPLSPVLFGGGQQALRPGTIPVALAVGFGLACCVTGQSWEKEAERLNKLTRLLLEELQAGIPYMRVNGALSPRLPGSLNICLPGVDAAALLLKLDKQLSLSTGAACASGKGMPSPVLKTIGLSDTDAASSIRISLGRPTTKEEVLFAAKTLCDAVGMKKRKAA